MAYEEGARSRAPRGADDRRRRPEIAPHDVQSTGADESKSAGKDQSEEVLWHGYGPLSADEAVEVNELKRQISSDLIGIYVDRLSGVEEACKALGEPSPSSSLLLDMVLGALGMAAGALAGVAAQFVVKRLTALGDKGVQLIASSVKGPASSLVTEAVPDAVASGPVTLEAFQRALNKTLGLQQRTVEKSTNRFLAEVDTKTPTRDILADLRHQASASARVRAEAAPRQRVATIVEWARSISRGPEAVVGAPGVLHLHVAPTGRSLVVVRGAIKGLSPASTTALRVSGLTLGEILHKGGLSAVIDLPSQDTIWLHREKPYPSLVDSANEPAGVYEALLDFAHAKYGHERMFSGGTRQLEREWIDEAIYGLPLAHVPFPT